MRFRRRGQSEEGQKEARAALREIEHPDVARAFCEAEYAIVEELAELVSDGSEEFYSLQGERLALLRALRMVRRRLFMQATDVDLGGETKSEKIEDKVALKERLVKAKRLFSFLSGGEKNDST